MGLSINYLSPTLRIIVFRCLILVEFSCIFLGERAMKLENLKILSALPLILVDVCLFPSMVIKEYRYLPLMVNR